MNNFFKEIITLDTTTSTGPDLGKLIFLNFFRDKELFIDGKSSSLEELVRYYYQFYSDNENMRQFSNNFIINNIYNYTFIDLIKYTENILKDILDSVTFISYSNYTLKSSFKISNNEINFFDEKLSMIINMLFLKYTNYEFTDIYTNKISKEQFENYVLSNSKNKCLRNTIPFNRAMENLNFCIITEETFTENLDVVIINKNCRFRNNSYNYLTLEKSVALEYRKGKIKLDKRGFFIRDSKIIGLLPISFTKGIRNLF